MYKLVQSREFLGRLLRPLLKTGLSLMGNVLKPLVHHKPSGNTILIISNEENSDIMKIASLFKNL